MMSRSSIHLDQRGFTLIEAIMVIVITGIVGAMVAVFIRAPIEGYIDTVTRAELTDAGDTALRRLARDVQAALPNSLRMTNPGSDKCVEFLPTVGGGRYRAERSSAGLTTDDILDFTTADTAFDVLASTNLLPGMFSIPHHVVIYNLGIPGADAYDITDITKRNRAAIAATSTPAKITLMAANKFPFQAPERRFHVIPDFSVIYSCSGGAQGTLRRSIRSISAVPLSTCPANGEVLVDHVDCDLSRFTYVQVASQRNSLLTTTLIFTQPGARGNETIRLYQEVHVSNVP